MKKIVGIYHKSCIDGTAAAAVLLRKFPEAQLFPLGYSYPAEDLEPILALLDAETECYTVDCGIGVRDFLASGCRVTTIDHHESVREEFESLAREHANYMYVFDNEKSGASLAWAFFFPGEPEPELVKYVEDSDLWKWKLGEDTKYVNNYLSMFRNDPLAMLGFFSGDLSGIKEKGRVIATYADMQIAEAVERPPLTLRIGEYLVPAYNITEHQSASGALLSEQTGKAVILFTLKGDLVTMSIRSRDGQAPRSLGLVKHLGGGGHQNSAGARVSLSQFMQMIV